MIILLSKDVIIMIDNQGKQILTIILQKLNNSYPFVDSEKTWRLGASRLRCYGSFSEKEKNFKKRGDSS